MKVTPPLEWVIYPLKAIFFFSFIFNRKVFFVHFTTEFELIKLDFEYALSS